MWLGCLIHAVDWFSPCLLQAGQCRVMSYCPSLATLVASQPSSSPLFPGFGVKKVGRLVIEWLLRKSRWVKLAII